MHTCRGSAVTWSSAKNEGDRGGGEEGEGGDRGCGERGTG